MSFPFRLVVLMLAAGATVVAVQDQWPPSLHPVPEEQPAPVLSAADQMKTFFLPPGYRVELVASEPMVQDPVAIDFDPAGRMWLIEMPGYMPDAAATGELEPTGRIVVLEDVDRNGTLDRRTVFADGLVLPRAIKVVDGGVLIAEPPTLWFMADTNGDGRADRKDAVSENYGRREANVEHNANSLTWALDNWLHTSETDVYFRWKNGTLESRPTLSRGQWGNSQDDGGRIYRNSNSAVLYVDTVPTPYYARHQGLVRTRGSYESLLGENGEVNEVYPVRPTPGVNRGYQTGVLRADKTLATYTAVHSPLVYRGDRLPSELHGNVFVAEPSGNLVSRILISDTGSGLASRRAYEEAEFLASTDERFRPVYLSNAPDGTLYVVDMYRGIIQHRGYITEYLYEQIKMRNLEPPTGLGRIYRIVHDTTQRDATTSLANASSAEVVAALAHPNGWWRDTAQRLLVERRDASVVPQLTQLVQGARDWRTRLHALWTLDGMDAIQASLVIEALGDSHRDVRVGAVRVAERFLESGQSDVRQAVLALINDGDWAVRQQLAASVGAIDGAAKVDAAVRLFEQHGDEPVVVDALLSGLRGVEVQVVDRLLAGPHSPERSAAVSMLAATVFRAADTAAVSALLARAGEAPAGSWQESALLVGAEVALLNATPPGTPVAAGRGRGGAPEIAGNAPGARGGPGGARAFPEQNEGGGRAANANAGGGGRGRGGRGRAGGPAFQLPAEPAAALARAGAGDPAAGRFRNVLDRIGWPGKAGMSTVRPLTAQEQQRFDQGQQVYQNLCVACHQTTGLGAEKVAPSLVGSAYLEGAPSRAIRILLQGKEGPTGLMPPLGQTLDNDQVAQVLTFVRRSWGNTADPVVPFAVEEIRGELTPRVRPWTDAELRALPE